MKVDLVAQENREFKDSKFVDVEEVAENVADGDVVIWTED